MSALIILITYQVQAALNERVANIEVIQVFGSETIVVEGKRVAEGSSAYVEGEPEEFRKLLKQIGELWTSTNPMMGDWNQQLAPEETATENNNL